jgi:hypothetical protein
MIYWLDLFLDRPMCEKESSLYAIRVRTRNKSVGFALCKSESDPGVKGTARQITRTKVTRNRRST